MTHDFPTIEEVVAMHDALIGAFGGSPGIRDEGAIAAALMRPQLGYYDGLIQEAAALETRKALNGRLGELHTTAPHPPGRCRAPASWSGSQRRRRTAAAVDAPPSSPYRNRVIPKPERQFSGAAS